METNRNKIQKFLIKCKAHCENFESLLNPVSKNFKIARNLAIHLGFEVSATRHPAILILLPKTNQQIPGHELLFSLEGGGIV